MPIQKIFPYLYIFAWLILSFISNIYFTNYVYEPLLIFISGTALYYTFFAVSNYNLPAFFKFLFLFVFVLVIYGAFIVFLGEDIYWQATGRHLRQYLYELWLLSSMLSVVPIYVFTCQGFLNDKNMKWLFFLMFFDCIITYYGAVQEQKIHAVLMNLNQEEFTVTSVYSFLSIIPLIILFKNKQFLQFVLLGIIFVYLVLSAKRGAVVLGGISIIVVVAHMLALGSRQKKIMGFVLTCLFLVGIYLFINQQLETNPYFTYRIEQTLNGDTSGRDEYAKNVFDYYCNSTSLLQFFFGIGAQGTLSVNASFAHNDWIAILLEQGLFGAFLYLLYWCCFVYTWLKSNLYSDFFVVIGLLLMIGLGKTVISMYYLPISAEMMASSGFFAITLGFYLGKAFPQHDSYVIQVPLEGNV